MMNPNDAFPSIVLFIQHSNPEPSALSHATGVHQFVDKIKMRLAYAIVSLADTGYRHERAYEASGDGAQSGVIKLNRPSHWQLVF
jgi:hypothetical protein